MGGNVLYIFIYYASVQTPIQFTYKKCRISIVNRNNIQYCTVLQNVMKHEVIYTEIIKAPIFGQSNLSLEIVYSDWRSVCQINNF